jgi:MFS transporter, ACS family, D-galactonate transporter
VHRTTRVDNRMAAFPNAPPIAASHKWMIVVLLSLGMVIAYVDRANLSAVLALKDFRDWIKIDDNGRGLLNSTFFWSYALLQIPAGWVVDRYGSKRPYAIGFAVWSLASAATGLVQGVGQLVMARLALGVGESVSTAASLRWIRTNCAEKERGLATGVLFAGTKVGAAVGVPIAVALAARFGWRLMFVALGLGGLAWLVGWLLSVRDDSGGTQATLQPAEAGVRREIKVNELLASPAIWGILLGTFAYNYFIYFCLTWLPAYFTESRHLTPQAMSLYTMFSFGGMAAVGILAGWVADRFIARGGNPIRVRRTFTLLGFIVAATELIGMLSSSNGVALFFAIFSLTGLGLATANYWALTQTIFPSPVIGRMVGLQNFASNVSGILAPIVTGWLKHKTGGYGASGWAVLVVLMMGLVSYGLLVGESAGQRFRGEAPKA